MQSRLFPALVLVAALTALPRPASAQLAAPNASGAAIGHIHINAKDVDVQSRFWEQLGGKIVQREKITMAQFPGIYILMRKQARFLKGEADGASVRGHELELILPDVTVEAHAGLRNAIEAGDTAQQRRLATAISGDEADPVGITNNEAEVGEQWSSGGEIHRV